MDRLQAWVAERNFASELDRFYILAPDDIPYGTAKYVVLALWRLRDGQYINFRSPDLRPSHGRFKTASLFSNGCNFPLRTIATLLSPLSLRMRAGKPFLVVLLPR
jgi:hypothetical protein